MKSADGGCKGQARSGRTQVWSNGSSDVVGDDKKVRSNTLARSLARSLHQLYIFASFCLRKERCAVCSCWTLVFVGCTSKWQGETRSLFVAWWPCCRPFRKKWDC